MRQRSNILRGVLSSAALLPVFACCVLFPARVCYFHCGERAAESTNMHLPDGFLDARTALLSTGAAVAGVGVALRQTRNSLEPRQMPMLGLAAAFVFAAQMLNFPVAGGTSGHLIGGVLTAVLLGPSAAVLVMTCVLIVQCLMFADGGLLVLGANVFNMAIVSVCGGYGVFRVTRRLMPGQEQRSVVFATAFAGWAGTVLAALSCAGQLALSGTVSWAMAFPAMVNVHMLIGMGEGLASGLIVLAVLRAHPEMVQGAQARGVAPTALVGYGLVVALGLAVFVAPFACSWPDGLETVARALGFEGKAAAPVLPVPFSDYRFPWVGSVSAATALAALVGALLAFIAAYVLSRILVPAMNVPKKDGSSTN
jgi:cobalt/nickel transport system permease protein